MRRTDLSIHHSSDEELLRLADGELSSQQASEVHAHLEACWNCRGRLQEIQTAITGLARAHHAELDPQLPPIAGPRALLQARLTEFATAAPTRWWDRVSQFNFGIGSAVLVCALLLATATGIFLFRDSSRRGSLISFASLDTAAIPNRELTPGAIRQVTLSDVCSVPEEDVVGDVSSSLRQRVLQEYGIADARPEDYEIDYLIAPRLGGTEDIRNLWPEPYRARVWNAHTKDALEQRLHELVCRGDVDLSTAQHDIATNWIAAYKKYFHTDKPLPLTS